MIAKSDIKESVIGILEKEPFSFLSYGLRMRQKSITALANIK